MLCAISSPLFSPLQLSAHAETQAHFQLLNLFAYGTWSQYRDNRGAYPPLEAAHHHKLKQLSVVSLAKANQQLAYSDLLRELDIADLRSLEDFLIECMYRWAWERELPESPAFPTPTYPRLRSGVIRAKLDQQRQSLIVFEALGRDVDESELRAIGGILAEWLENSKARRPTPCLPPCFTALP